MRKIRLALPLWIALLTLFCSTPASAFSFKTWCDSSSTFVCAVLGGSNGTPTCGTGCTSVTAGSTNVRGSVTSSSAVSSIAINWSGTLTYTPVCVISSNETTALPAFTVSTTTLTVTTASAVTSKVFSWICVQ